MQFVEYETLEQEWFETDETKSGWDSLGWGEANDQELVEVLETNKFGLPTKAKFQRLKDPEYELYISEDDTEASFFSITGWIPISNDRIKRLDDVQKYIDSGILRKYQKQDG